MSIKNLADSIKSLLKYTPYVLINKESVDIVVERKDWFKDYGLKEPEIIERHKYLFRK